MLLIDCHEPITIIEKLKSSLKVEVLKLKYGDYSFSDILIERKTLSDFFLSLKDNRLAEQMESINRYYNEKYLLIEGFFDFSYVNNLNYLYSKLADITLDFDIRVMFTKDSYHTVNILKRLYLMKNRGYIFNISRKDKIYHLVKLFEINKQRLEILFSHFGSINNIANANKKQFKGIRGIGKSTVEKVKNLLGDNIFEE